MPKSAQFISNALNILPKKFGEKTLKFGGKMPFFGEKVLVFGENVAFTPN
jgi:hypothetical protein